MGSKEGLCLYCGRFTGDRNPRDGLAECERPECIEAREEGWQDSDWSGVSKGRDHTIPVPIDLLRDLRDAEALPSGALDEIDAAIDALVAVLEQYENGREDPDWSEGDPPPPLSAEAVERMMAPDAPRFTPDPDLLIPREGEDGDDESSP